jgi:glycosyltransferase involved in cell wall biosynthesis
LASSEPEYYQRHTGVGGALHYLFEALGREVDLVDVYQPKPSAIRQVASRVATYSRNGDRWHRSFKRHVPYFQAKSDLCRQKIEALASDIDVVLQWEFFFAPTTAYPSPVPYCIYNDCTTSIIAREFSDWMRPTVLKRVDIVQRRLIRNASHVYTFTDQVRQSVIDDYGVSAERVTKVHAGINFERELSPRDAPADSHRMLFIGNGYTRKGLALLLRAMPLIRAAVPLAQLIVIGAPQGFECPPTEGVTYLGEVTDKERLAQEFERASLFVLPTRAEPFGHVFAEAMSYSLPCLGTQTGGVPEVIRHGETGFVLDKDDLSGFVEHAVLLLKDPELRRKMGRAGQARVQGTFTWPSVVQKMLPSLEQAAQSRRARPRP